MNSTPVLNITSRSFAGEVGRERPHSVPRPAFPGLVPEQHNFNFAPSADRRDAIPTGFRFAQRGVPPSPLHDV